MKAMRRLMSCLTALIALAAVASGQDNGCYKRTVKLPEPFARQVVERVFKVDDTDEAVQQRVRAAIESKRAGHFLCAEPIALSRTGKPGLLIHMADVENSFGGMYSYPVLVYERTAKGYELLLEEEAGYLSPITALKTFTNGYRDIRTQNHSSAAEHEITIYKFDGRRYRPRVCITETYVGKRRGRERFRYTRHKYET
jgi:hypothetical protein